jgi:hypothetical protein
LAPELLPLAVEVVRSSGSKWEEQALALTALLPHLPPDARPALAAETLAVALLIENPRHYQYDPHQVVLLIKNLRYRQVILLQMAPFYGAVSSQAARAVVRALPRLLQSFRREMQTWFKNLSAPQRERVIDDYLHRAAEIESEGEREKIVEAIHEIFSVTEEQEEVDWAQLVEQLEAESRDELLKAIAKHAPTIAAWGGEETATRIARAIYEFGAWKGVI